MGCPSFEVSVEYCALDPHSCLSMFSSQICNIMPGVIPAFFIKPHFATFLLFTAIRQWQTVQSHAGYHLPWDPLNCGVFKDGAARHDFHHSGNKGCFGKLFFVARSSDLFVSTSTMAWQTYRKFVGSCLNFATGDWTPMWDRLCGTEGDYRRGLPSKS